ncbi:hypothetical protein [Terriglobus sp.]|uniref:hypothetical protein n=1 Tax=Terriglobus sp. TaxID=1889013 RepID=UPI003AFFE534
MKVGGYDKEVDKSKLGGAVLIGACVVLAVRTARWPVTVHNRDQPDNKLWQEVGYAVRLALEVITELTGRHPNLFAQKDIPWWLPGDEDLQP